MDKDASILLDTDKNCHEGQINITQEISGKKASES